MPPPRNGCLALGEATGRRRSGAAGWAIVALALWLPVTSGHAANIRVGSDTRVAVQLKSMKELRDQDLIKQRLDYSCGGQFLRFSSAIAKCSRLRFWLKAAIPASECDTAAMTRSDKAARDPLLTCASG